MAKLVLIKEIPKRTGGKTYKYPWQEWVDQLRDHPKAHLDVTEDFFPSKGAGNRAIAKKFGLKFYRRTGSLYLRLAEDGKEPSDA